SGNLGDAVTLWNDGGNGNVPDGNLVEGNYIGTDLKGETALGNGGVGIDGTQGTDNTTTRNPGAGPALAGVYLGTPTGAATTGTRKKVEGNLSGSDAAGTLALGNATGVVLQDGFEASGSGAHDNLIGGTTAATRNVISGSQGFAVDLALASHN